MEHKTASQPALSGWAKEKADPYEINTALVPHSLHTSESDENKSSHASETSGRPLTVWGGRIGTAAFVALFIGTLTLAVAMVVLAALWRGGQLAANNEPAGSLWNGVVLKGWLPRLVTICTAAIRLAIAEQAGVLSAMLAAVVLERFGAKLFNVPRLSIARSSAPHPLAFASTTYTDSVSPKAPLTASILVLAAIITTLSTFFSTILLSDFASISIPGPAVSSPILFGRADPYWDVNARDTVPYAVPPVTKSAPVTFSRFAEYSESGSHGPRYEDTGVSVRALLPFETEKERTTLRAYNGPAALLNSRVVCVSPEVDLRLVAAVSSKAGVGHTLVLQGILNMTDPFSSVPGVALPSSNQPGSQFKTGLGFACAVPLQNTTGSLWRASLCEVLMRTSNVSKAILPIEGPYTPFPVYNWSSTVDNNVLLVMNLTENVRWVKNGIDNARRFIAMPFNFNTSASTNTSWHYTHDGAWTGAVFDGPAFNSSGADAGTLTVKVAISACVTSFYQWNREITAFSNSDGTEPSVGWNLADGGGASGSSSGAVFKDVESSNTLAVRQQLNVDRSTSLSIRERGLLQLQPDPRWSNATSERGGSFDVTSLSDQAWDGGLRDILPTVEYFYHLLPQVQEATSQSSLMMVFQTGDPEDLCPHRSQVVVFQDTLRATRNPALAVQAFVTILQQMLYYDAISIFSAVSDSTSQFSVLVLAPVRWMGFIIVASLLAGHLVLVFFTMGLFARQTWSSRLGSSWQAISQVVSDSTIEPLLWATDAKDSDVKRIFCSRSEQGKYGIQKSTITGREEVREL